MNKAKLPSSTLLPQCLLIMIIALTSLFWGCNNGAPESTKWNLDAVDLNNELFLIQTDDRYGEWGGNTFFIRVYRDEESRKLFIDYKEHEGRVGPPDPPNPNSNLKINWYSGQPVLAESNGVLVTQNHIDLISEAINKLLSFQSNNAPFPSHSGISNRVMLSDSTLIIDDYPSCSWEKFHKLVRAVRTD